MNFQVSDQLFRKIIFVICEVDYGHNVGYLKHIHWTVSLLASWDCHHFFFFDVTMTRKNNVYQCYPQKSSSVEYKLCQLITCLLYMINKKSYCGGISIYNAAWIQYWTKKEENFLKESCDIEPLKDHLDSKATNRSVNKFQLTKHHNVFWFEFLTSLENYVWVWFDYYQSQT